MQAINSVNKVRLPPPPPSGAGPSGGRRVKDIQAGDAGNRHFTTHGQVCNKKLKENGMIIEKFNFRDARQVLYQIKDVLTAEEAQKAAA